MNQLKCPSSDDRLKKMWHIYTVEHCSVIKKEQNPVFAAKLIQRETIILSEISQSPQKTNIIHVPCSVLVNTKYKKGNRYE